MQVNKKVIYQVEDFNLQFEPMESTISIEKTKTGYTIKYLINDDVPFNPREDEHLGTMVCFHKRYSSLGDKINLNFDNFNNWDDLYDYLKNEKKAIIILPLYMYEHSGISIKVGSFNGLLPEGHARFDSGQIGFIYCTTGDLKRIGTKKSNAIKRLKAEVDTYSDYVNGDCYCLVREDFNENKEQINYDICGGFFGIEYAEKALKSYI